MFVNKLLLRRCCNLRFHGVPCLLMGAIQQVAGRKCLCENEKLSVPHWEFAVMVKTIVIHSEIFSRGSINYVAGGLAFTSQRWKTFLTFYQPSPPPPSSLTPASLTRVSAAGHDVQFWGLDVIFSCSSDFLPGSRPDPDSHWTKLRQKQRTKTPHFQELFYSLNGS